MLAGNGGAVDGIPTALAGVVAHDIHAEARQRCSSFGQVSVVQRENDVGHIVAIAENVRPPTERRAPIFPRARSCGWVVDVV